MSDEMTDNEHWELLFLTGGMNMPNLLSNMINYGDEGKYINEALWGERFARIDELQEKWENRNKGWI